jgi:hypothetical protein
MKWADSNTSGEKLQVWSFTLFTHYETVLGDDDWGT